MFSTNDIERTLENHNKRSKELEIKMESLDREEKAFLESLKVTSEQLTAYIDNEENFTEKNWKSLQKERKKLEEKLQTELDNIRNPKEVKEAYSGRKIDSHWLFVR